MNEEIQSSQTCAIDNLLQWPPISKDHSIVVLNYSNLEQKSLALKDHSVLQVLCTGLAVRCKAHISI